MKSKSVFREIVEGAYENAVIAAPSVAISAYVALCILPVLFANEDRNNTPVDILPILNSTFILGGFAALGGAVVGGSKALLLNLAHKENKTMIIPMHHSFPRERVAFEM